MIVSGLGDTSKARIFFNDALSRIRDYDDQRLAYAVWLALPKGVRAAFRGKNDLTPVYSHDFVDRM